MIKDSIKPYSNDELIPSAFWEFNEVRGLWSIKAEYSDSVQIGSLRIEFQEYPIGLTRVLQRRRILRDSSILNSTDTDSVISSFRSPSSSNIFNSDLNQSGSLSRGIVVGTNQDFALESGLQFQLDGKLTDDVTINASLTDRSLPIQPDGSTQNLREFDRVYIQIQAPKTQLEMGDVDISLENTEFARLNRRIQGANTRLNTGFGDYSGALSVARGTFRIVNFRGQDGVQGPYRLTNANGQEFVTVLAGSEKVYIDGLPINRGEENQYIIDYGIGEVYFTNNLLITDETRIVIEYQFLDQDFTRTLIAADGRDDNLLNGRLSVGATFIREADGDNLLSQQALSENEIDLLKGVGDNLSSAIVSGADTVDVTNEQDAVLYARVDTVFNGQNFQIFKNIPGSPDAVFTVRFTRVEDGTGSYQRVGGSVNGLLFEWVGPGNGNYEPFRQLPAPRLQQMLSLDANLKISENVFFYGEFAGSSTDINRFSSLDDGDNNDLAYISGLQIQNMKLGEGTVGFNARRRFSGGNFNFFDRTRDIEFTRKWNLQTFEQSEETLDEAELDYQISKTRFALNYGSLQRFGINSSKQLFNIYSREENLPFINYRQDWVVSDNSAFQQDGNWFRNRLQSGYEFETNGFKLTPSLFYEQEDRRQRSTVTDSLLNTSFAFFEIGPGVEIEKNRWKFGMKYFYRKDNFVDDQNNLDKASDAVEQNYFVEFRPSRYVRTKQEVSLRNRNFTDEFQQLGNTNREGILLRSNTNYRMKSEVLEGSVFYEANTERRALLQESFIEVGPELGVFTWNDINGDGIQQIDEFFPEITPNEGTFVRQFLPSDELFPIINLNVRLRNTIKPFQIILKEGWLSGIILRSRFDIRESSTTEELADVYLIRVNTFRNNNSTIQGRFIIDKELDLFPDYDKVDAILRYGSSEALNRRSNETQNINIRDFGTEFTYRPSFRYGFLLKGLITENESISDQLTSRNFDIIEYNIEPGLIYNYSRSLATIFSINYSNRTDRFPIDDVEARIIKYKVDSRAFLFRNIQTNSRIELRDIRLDGASSRFGLFELTDGLGEGRNLVWSINASYNVSRLVRFTLNYDGRTVRNGAPIQTGKITVSAIF